MKENNIAVELDGVSFGYPPHMLGRPALEDVTLRVEKCDFLGVIGPNGGGKTTLLQIMLGLVRPQKGKVRVFGKSPARVRRQIGYVPQNGHLDPTAPASVLDVVLMGRLGATSWGWRYAPSHAEAALEALRLTGVDDLAMRAVSELSGGQLQRVLIARALAGRAEILLLDEPTAAVDALAEQNLIDLLHKLNERITIVMVSHDISFISTHLKHVACMNRTLTCHEAGDVSREVIASMYDGDVRLIHHAGDCPLADPGCAHGCQAIHGHADETESADEKG